MVKLVHGAPRSTFTYLVEGHLAAGYVSLRNQILSRYSGFFRKLLNSPSKEVIILSRIVFKDSRSKPTPVQILNIFRSSQGLLSHSSTHLTR